MPPPAPRPRSGAARREPPPERVSLPAPEAGSGGPPGPFSPTRRGKPPLPARRGAKARSPLAQARAPFCGLRAGRSPFPGEGAGPRRELRGKGDSRRRYGAPPLSSAWSRAPGRCQRRRRPGGAASPPPHPRRAPALPAAIMPAPLQRRSAPHGRLTQFTHCHCNGGRGSRACARQRAQTVFVNRG